jgi:hypothetical protein
METLTKDVPPGSVFGLGVALVGLLVVPVVLARFADVATAQSRLLLLTPGEAAQLNLAPGDRFAAPVLRGPSGPRIVVRAPVVVRTDTGAVIETTPVTRFSISFEPNGAPVDMDSLDITARKGPFSVSLTSRLKPFIQGTSLQADTVTVPEGRFMVQIGIVDKAGARTVEHYRLEVRANRS